MVVWTRTSRVESQRYVGGYSSTWVDEMEEVRGATLASTRDLTTCSVVLHMDTAPSLGSSSGYEFVLAHHIR